MWRRVSEIVQSGKIPEPPKMIEFDLSLTKRLTGLDINEDKVIKILSDLGFKIDINKVCSVHIPTWRRDVKEGADLVEEIIRIYGYHNIQPIKLPELNKISLIRKHYQTKKLNSFAPSTCKPVE